MTFAFLRSMVRSRCRFGASFAMWLIIFGGNFGSGDTLAENDGLEEDFTLDPDDGLDEELEDASTEGGRKRAWIKMALFVLVGMLLLGGIAAGLWFFFFKKDAAGTDADINVSPAVQSTQSTAMPEEDTVFEEIIHLGLFERVPLKENANMSLVSVDISLELVDTKSRHEVLSAAPNLRSVVERQMAEFTWMELRNSDGKIRLKYQLLREMNSQLGQVLIRNVYFRHFIMQ